MGGAKVLDGFWTTDDGRPTTDGGSERSSVVRRL